MFLPLNCWSRNWFNLGAQPTEIDLHAQTRRLTTGGASSSFEMIISQRKSHGDITRVFIAIRPLKRTHFSELSISRLTAYIREASLWFDARAY